LNKLPSQQPEPQAPDSPLADRSQRTAERVADAAGMKTSVRPAPHATADQTLTGHVLGGRYRLERLLGEGGMGRVYFARDEQVAGETFAIKVLHGGLRANALLLRDEVHKTRKLSHPNILDVHSLNSDGALHYVLMECLEGKPLNDLLDEEFGRGMPFSRAWPIIQDVGAALAYAHDHSVVHSDLKPANIFVTTSGRTKLLDFGIARASRGRTADAGPHALTPAYASCEMLQKREPDARDDIYSFGCVIYEMLSGKHPFSGLSALEALTERLRPQPLAVLSRKQNHALARALAFERAKRTGSVEELLATLEPGRAPITGNALAFTVAAIAAVILVAALVSFLRQRYRTTSSPVAFVPPPRSIAVLPLVNESGDANQQYFSDGISEDLITELSQFSGLKVIGRLSSFQFRNPKEDSRSIGAKLQVAHLLEGSVRRSGDAVRVSAELINTKDGSTQWSERYDRPYKDLFALQDKITRAVVAALRAKLVVSRHAAEQSEQPPSGSLDAYNAYLQGRFFVSRDTAADDRTAIEYFVQATELDPRYALALSWQSKTWTDLGSQYLQGDALQEAFAKARSAADRALSLAPELAAAHLARGDVLQNADFDWRGAEAEYRRATEFAPNDGQSKIDLGGQLATFGEVEQAIELTRQALATEPLRANWYHGLATYLSGLNRLDEAEWAIRRALELQPRGTYYYEQLAVIEIQRGRAQAALAAAQQESPGPPHDVALALARQIGGDQRAADAALKTLIDNDAGIAAYLIAQVYALRNDATETFAWLDRAWVIHDNGIGDLLYDPLILRFKADPRFAAFCRKVGLPVPAEISLRKFI
jgi:TolB-like protein/Tfp pilus assembly protein PilF